ncbi:hypothetical protein LPB136_13540 [Tenacibaculum todarodis]|uniref:Uncharacterized protein n=1 Tax=Tenacibaculum todarodis TaxID=1850252 RepID=A0A1L3JMK3_9FLAO|nr:hypothetical protein [Tenacibaculum todarodis]APG66333.1 hypothetical protein LPB136_13540 [Tenacibaculum todarodis]
MNHIIKKNAKIAWEKGDKHKAYTIAWELPIEEFYLWITKNKKGIVLSKEFFSDFLILLNPNWINKPNSNLLIEYYFSKRWFAESFEGLLLNNVSEVYLNGVKKSFSFLDLERLIFLENLKFLPQNLKVELSYWQFWYQQHNDYWNPVIQYFENNKSSGLDILINLIVAFEKRFFETKSQLDMQYAGEVLSVLIAYIQHLNILDFSITPEKDDIFKKYYSFLNSNRQECLFDLGNKYIQVRENIIRYALEDGLEMKEMSLGEFYFIENEEYNKKWEKDGERYILNENYYYSRGDEYFSVLESEGKIEYANNHAKEENRNTKAKRFGIELAVKDLGLLDKDMPEGRPKIKNVISFLNTHARNVYERIEKPLFALKDFSFQMTYQEAVNYRLLQTKKIMEPIFAYNIVSLSDMSDRFGDSITIKQMNCLTNDFSFKWSSKTFDPFNLFLSLWQKPFIKLGQLVISPISIISAFTGLYAITESILKNYKPNEGNIIEKILHNNLTRNDGVWKSETNWQECNGDSNGDADVILEDNEYIVLMQLKRTSQKTDLRQLASQVPQDRKAISQLKKAHEHIVNKGEKRKIKLWYVTTAMEKIGVEEQNVRRVNYQELLQLQKMYFSSLAELINRIEK